MASKTFTGSIIGLDAERVEVEADARPGLTRFYVVGLPDAMVQEARERVKSAVKHSGFLFPRGTAIVNLAPADLRKAGTLYDLPIAVALIGLRHPASLATQHALLAGELSLDGQLRPIHGSMSLAALAKHCGASEVIVPRANAKEASLVPGIRVYGAESLSEVVAHLEGRTRLPRTPTQILERGLMPRAFPDFSSVRGQEQAKRALEIAAAGGHNVLMQARRAAGKRFLRTATLPFCLRSNRRRFWRSRESGAWRANSTPARESCPSVHSGRRIIRHPALRWSGAERFRVPAKFPLRIAAFSF